MSMHWPWFKLSGTWSKYFVLAIFHPSFPVITSETVVKGR